MRMIAQQPDKRYTAEEALQHPWITRRYEDDIPLSLTDKMVMFDKTQLFARIIKSLMFITYIHQEN